MKYIKFYISYANAVFYHIESFSANKILNNVKINEIY